MSSLEILLLGPFQVRLGGEVITAMRSDKVRALLAYLAVEADQPHRREKLAGLLWPGYPEESARASLRRALADLRAAIEDERANPPYLQVTRQTIQFDKASHAWVDVNAFCTLVRSPKSVDEKTISGWEEAAGLYRGEFIEGFSLPDSAAFDEWLLVTREQLERQELETLEKLVESLEQRGEHRRGLAYAWRAVELDPLRESAQRGLMRLLALSGQREAALAQYGVCEKALMAVLGVTPSVETRELHERILREVWPPAMSYETGVEIRPPRDIGACPYRGLAAFREQDAPYFFGRENFIQKVLELTQTRKVVAVILGSSGSGKSSVVYAGVIPRLRSQDDWLIAELRPGTRPFHSISGALLPLLEPELSETKRLVESQKLAAALDVGTLALHQLVERVLEKSPGKSRILLFIDQFEELYTLCPQGESRQRFLKSLLETIERYRERREHTFALLLTMRADFMGQALSHRQFADVLQSSSLMLGPMTRDELRAAIEKPAELQGAACETGLVERILDDVGDEPGNLPLLEFALTLLWKNAQSGWLTHEAYEQIGEIKGALARYAEQVFGELDDDDQGKAQRVFLQLVRPGEGTEDTRRVASRAEIGDENWSLVQHLADKRLVVTGRDIAGNDTVEVVHEALIGNWDRLRSWIEAERTFRVWQEGLRVAIRQWEATGEDEGALLRGVPLAEAEGWLVKKEPDLSLVEFEFINASQKFQQNRLGELERSRRRVIAGLSFGLIVTLILASFAGWQWRSAQQARVNAVKERDLTRLSLSRSLAAQAQQLVTEDLDLALLLSVEAVNIDASTEARSSLLSTLSEKPQLAYFLHGHEDEVVATELSSNGRYLATGSVDGTIILWELSGIDSTAIPLKLSSIHDHKEAITNLAFSPDSRLLASGSSDGRMNLWDVPSGERAAPALTGHTGYLWSICFSPDGRYLISSGADGQILLWDLGNKVDASRQPDNHPLASDLKTISSVAVNPDGSLLAAGLSDGSIILWDLDNLTLIGELPGGHDRLIRALSFSPDGQMLASGGDDQAIIIWDTDRASPAFGRQIGASLTGHANWITSLVFHPHSQSLISTGKDGLILMWDLSKLIASGQRPTIQVLDDQSSPVWDLDISPDGHWLVTGGGEKHAILWDLTQIHPLAQALLPEAMEIYRPILTSLTFEPMVLDLTYSPDSALLASAYFDGSIILWDRSSGKPLKLLSAHSTPTSNVDSWYWAEIYPSYGVAFSPDGHLLASTTEHHIYLWDVNPESETLKQPLTLTLEGHTKTVNTIAFSPDGQILATGGDDLSIIIWDLNQNSATFGKSIVQLELEPKSAIMDLYFDDSGSKLVSITISNIHIIDMAEMPPQANRSIVLPISSRIYDPAFRIYSTNPTASILAAPEENMITFWGIDQSLQTFGKKLPVSLENPGGRIYATDFSADSRMFASGDNTEHVQLWDMLSYQAIGPPLLGHQSDISNVRFSPDGRSLASGDGDGVVIQWALDLESWVANACRRANRNLTQQEWQRYFGDEPYRATCPQLQVATVQ